MKGQIVIRRPRFLIALVILNSLVLTGILNIHPVVGMLNALDRANNDYSPSDTSQITETNTKIVIHTWVFTVNNCDGEELRYGRGPWFDEGPYTLHVVVSEPFDTDDVRLLLVNKYKGPGFGRRRDVLARLSEPLKPGTHMQYTWSVEEQTWTGYVESKGKPGRGTYTVHGWLSYPKIVSSKNLGCEF